MQRNEPTVQALAERVAKLEAQNRRFRNASLAALVAASAVVVMGQVRTSRVLEANEFVLKDNSGTVRGRLSVDTRIGPSLTFYRDKTDISALLASGDEPFLTLWRRAGANEQVSSMTGESILVGGGGQSSMLTNSGFSTVGKAGTFKVDVGEQGPT